MSLFNPSIAMLNIKFREATIFDVPEIARLCASYQENEQYWIDRIGGYINLEFNPHRADSLRVSCVAMHNGIVVGFIAGHLTTLSEYPGQIQWLLIDKQYRRRGIASKLLWIMAGWFIENNAFTVRVDVDPEDQGVQGFYRCHHVTSANRYWLYWDDIRVVLED
jgi:ribosomal protein S18 acetylase RimI-like enzyme